MRMEREIADLRRQLQQLLNDRGAASSNVSSGEEEDNPFHEQPSDDEIQGRRRPRFRPQKNDSDIKVEIPEFEVEKQQDTSKKSTYKPFIKGASSSKGSSSFQAEKTTVRKDKAKVDSQPMTTAKERRCFKCQRYGHIASECPNRRTITLKEVEETNVEEDEPIWDSDEEEEYVEQPDNGELLVIRKSLSSNMASMEEQRENIFQTRCTIKGKVCHVIVDSSSCTNVILRP
ncbi:hypothetical protein NL676_034843 [Syzygium grande]|nr:hypothetical protein NL676_034843 [Syzygium grande]